MPHDPLNFLLSVLAALGLAAACGFRVFVPLLVLSLAARAGWIGLSPGFAWIGSTPALVSLGLATVLEVGAYYVPWLDNLLDSIATPAAVVAGIVVSASSCIASAYAPCLQHAIPSVSSVYAAPILSPSAR